MRVPDSITPVGGFRAWVMGLGRLWSLSRSSWEAWPASGPLEARCQTERGPEPFSSGKGVTAPHGAPDPLCSCGIYCVRDPWNVPAIRSLGPWKVVVGRAEGWGRVVIGEKGWRAELARPIELFTNSWWDDHTRLQARTVAAAYGLPLVDWEAIGLTSVVEG